jgi:hypothetical protein
VKLNVVMRSDVQSRPPTQNGLRRPSLRQARTARFLKGSELLERHAA